MALGRVDDTDLRILAALYDDARMSNAALAQRVRLSPPPCWRRVQALQERGVILRYVPIVDMARIGLDVTAFVHVRLRRQTDRQLEIFEAAIRDQPEILDCYLMTGAAADYLLRVVAVDIDNFRDVLGNITKINAVSRISSSLVLRPVKSGSPPPLTALPTSRTRARNRTNRRGDELGHRARGSSR